MPAECDHDAHCKEGHDSDGKSAETMRDAMYDAAFRFWGTRVALLGWRRGTPRKQMRSCRDRVNPGRGALRGRGSAPGGGRSHRAIRSTAFAVRRRRVECVGLLDWESTLRHTFAASAGETEKPLSGYDVESSIAP